MMMTMMMMASTSIHESVKRKRRPKAFNILSQLIERIHSILSLIIPSNLSLMTKQFLAIKWNSVLCFSEGIIQINGAVVVVKWSACLSSIRLSEFKPR